MTEMFRSYFRHMPQEGFTPYLRPAIELPALDKSRLDVVLLESEERRILKTPINGDASMIVTYKNREGAVTSIQKQEADMNVLQLQGGRQEGYRLDAGLDWVALFADQLLQIAQHPESNLLRVTMPPLFAIEGFVDTSNRALARYKQFQSRIGMQHSKEENLFIRDIKK